MYTTIIRYHDKTVKGFFFIFMIIYLFIYFLIVKYRCITAVIFREYGSYSRRSTPRDIDSRLTARVFVMLVSFKNVYFNVEIINFFFTSKQRPHLTVINNQSFMKYLSCAGRRKNGITFFLHFVVRSSAISLNPPLLVRRCCGRHVRSTIHFHRRQRAFIKLILSSRTQA